MRTLPLFLLIAGILVAASPPSAVAADPPAPVRQENLACQAARHGTRRVAYVLSTACCGPGGNCVALLSTTTLPHGASPRRT